MKYTTNYSLKKPEGTDPVNIQDFNDNSDIIEQSLTDILYKPAGGSATVITLTINGTLKNCYPITFIASANNNGSPTTINGKPLYKPGTTTAPTLIAGKAYTVWYNLTGNCFFFKASTEGTATPAQVLVGVPYSNQDDVGLIGTMPDHTGASTLAAGVTSSPGYLYAWPKGGYYEEGNGNVACADGDFIPANIKTGINIFGQVGTYTSDATVIASDTLSGKTSYVNGAKVTGTMPNLAATTQSPQGYYPSGASLILAPNEGYHNAASTRYQFYDANYIATNIKNGISIFGLTGTYVPSFTAGDLLYLSSDNQSYTSATSATRIKEMKFTAGGSVRIKFDIATNILNNRAYGQIFVNGVPRGTLRSTIASPVTYTTYTEDITINANDLVQIYAYAVAGTQCNVKNMRASIAELPPTASVTYSVQ